MPSDNDIDRGLLIAVHRCMMNRKGKRKNLSINRESIRMLSRSEAEQVNGGEQSGGAPCTGIPPKLEPFANSDGAPCGPGRNI
jgi:hypothetical protein